MKGFLVLAGLLALVAAGCGGTSMAEETSPPDVTATTASGGELAPPVEGLTIDGKRIALADFRGRAVFVNVWASW